MSASESSLMMDGLSESEQPEVNVVKKLLQSKSVETLNELISMMSSCDSEEIMMTPPGFSEPKRFMKKRRYMMPSSPKQIYRSQGDRRNKPASQVPAYVRIERRPFSTENFPSATINSTRLQTPPKTLLDILKVHEVEELSSDWENKKTKRLILISLYQTIERALSRIQAHDINSLPVVNSAGIIGIIDALSIVNAFVDTLKTGDNMISKDFLNKTIFSLFTEKSNTWLISRSVSLLSAAAHFVQTKQERFLVVERSIKSEVELMSGPEINVNIITVADILRILVQNGMLLKNDAIFRKSLAELDLGRNLPKIISCKEITANAIKELGTSGCVGAAVVDQDGKLVSTFSHTDVKGINRRNCLTLNLPLEDFLARDIKRGWWVRPVCVQLSDTLYQTLLQFVGMKVHKMYIVDPDNKPIGEISRLDILRKILQ